MIESQSFQIVVVGGGLVGKTAALACAQLGLRVALLAPTVRVQTALNSRVYALSASAQVLFEQLRIWQALDPACLTPVYDMRIYGDALAELHFSAFQAHVPQLAWIIDASLLESALDVALRFQPNLVWLDRRAHDLSVLSERALLELDDGQVLKTQLVVGADGAQSWVRTQMGVKLERRDYQQMGIVANFKLEQPHRETAYQWFHKGEIMALLPLPENHASLVWSAHEQHAQALLALDEMAFAAELEAVVGNRFSALKCVSQRQSFPLSLQKVARLIAPRVALVGDAAHLIHPLAGQGMNLGLRDVAELAQVLAGKEPLRDLGDMMLLRRYERSRREDIQKLSLATDGLHRLFSWQGGFVRGIRNAGLTLLNQQSFIKRKLVASALGL
ncbi:UbiH/UbiF family hydroxylase [Mycoavidus sp. B2-EB]|uniref:UbiH/UbiF family hydroxylase n=1 Tax=Mycoavidus sp. B2-EB TaxID=2651972 RepID=UPI001628BFD1|nr:UbiH/UbiF family hydroxylase [Mycoavidus sp. B2-EB]